MTWPWNVNSAAKGLTSNSLNDSRLFCSGSYWDFLKSFIKFISGIKGSTPWDRHTSSLLLYARVYIQQPNLWVRKSKNFICWCAQRGMFDPQLISVEFLLLCLLICCFLLCLALWPEGQQNETQLRLTPLTDRWELSFGLRDQKNWISWES